MSTFDDPAKSPPSPADAQKVIAQVAELLGVDDPDHADHDTIDQALDALFAAVTGATGAPTKTAVEYPKQIDANALRRGRELTFASFAAVKRAFHR